MPAGKKEAAKSTKPITGATPMAAIVPIAIMAASDWVKQRIIS